MRALLALAIGLAVVSLAASAAPASSPLPRTCTAIDTKRDAVLASGGTASRHRYIRYCGHAEVAFRLAGKSYLIRGGSCYHSSGAPGIEGVNIGLVSFVRKPLAERGFLMWWQPPATEPGQQVTVAESSIQLLGFPEYAGDGTVVFRQTLRGAMFKLVGRSTIPRWAGVAMSGSFRCR
jgi:hypothetical protein